MLLYKGVRVWSTEEIAILYDCYPKGGARAVKDMLLDRSRGAINHKASRLNIVLDADTRHEINITIGAKNLKHGEGAENPNWKGGISKDNYHYKRKTIAKYPDKHKARHIFEAAVRKGVITRKPCEICGDPRSEGHHADYDKPLEVIWLCRTHHRERHHAKLSLADDGVI